MASSNGRSNGLNGSGATTAYTSSSSHGPTNGSSILNNGRARRVGSGAIPLKRKKSSTTANPNSSSLFSCWNNKAAVFPVLLLVAALLYMFGLIQSIRSLPDISSTHVEGAGVSGRLGSMVQKAKQKLHRPAAAANSVNRNNSNHAGQQQQQQEHHVIPPEERLKQMVLVLDDDETNVAELKAKQQQPRKQAQEATKKTDTNLYNLPPDSVWPISIRTDGLPTVHMVHPADPSSALDVPSFWADPIMTPDGPLMTRELALSVGSHDTSQNQPQTSLNSRTIFVAIASYRDFQCRQTVDSIFRRAKYPSRVRVGVVDQVTPQDTPCDEPPTSCKIEPEQPLCQYADQLDVYPMEANLAVGPVFARHVGHRLYRGEYYAMQIDAHVTFIQDWDVDIINQLESSGNDMAVLSTYLTDIEGSIDPVTHESKRKTRPIMCNTDYEGGHQGRYLRHKSQPERLPPIHGSPQLQPYWAAGFSFSRGHFVVNVPYDEYLPMIFQGEESSIGIRGFTYGYDFYAPERSVCFHTYANGKNQEKRNKVPKFWDNGPRYQGVGKKAMNRLLGIIGMQPEVDPSTWDHTEEARYGTGAVRPLSKFYKTFGIDIHRKRTEQNLCSFVQGGKMHQDFVQHLRRDGMGIDYGAITYEFKDPNPGADWFNN